MTILLKHKAVIVAGVLSVIPVQSVMAMNGGVVLDNQNSLENGYTLVAADEKNKLAQDFIQNIGAQAVSFLGNDNLSEEQKTSQFRALLNDSFDMRTIGRFAMGRHWRGASKEQRSEYLDLFNDMVIDVYAGRFSEYKGQGFEVVSSRADGKKDFLVSSYIVPGNGSKIKLDWRLRHKEGQYKIIDIIIEGVSMSLTQRSDFSSVIQRGGGNVDVLLDHLRK